MPRWEYHILVRSRVFDVENADWSIPSEAMLTMLRDLGADGWELVSAWPRVSLPRFNGLTSEEIFAFKRPIPE